MWPRYRILNQIKDKKERFVMCSFMAVLITTNKIVQAIAKSVIRDGRLES